MAAKRPRRNVPVAKGLAAKRPRRNDQTPLRVVFQIKLRAAKCSVKIDHIILFKNVLKLHSSVKLLNKGYLLDL
jgi:hypothetical protein